MHQRSVPDGPVLLALKVEPWVKSPQQLAKGQNQPSDALPVASRTYRLKHNQFELFKPTSLWSFVTEKNLNSLRTRALTCLLHHCACPKSSAWLSSATAAWRKSVPAWRHMDHQKTRRSTQMCHGGCAGLRCCVWSCVCTTWKSGQRMCGRTESVGSCPACAPHYRPDFTGDGYPHSHPGPSPLWSFWKAEHGLLVRLPRDSVHAAAYMLSQAQWSLAQQALWKEKENSPNRGFANRKKESYKAHRGPRLALSQNTEIILHQQT